ncbi:MAG: hypothetical protein ACXVIH_05440 [Ilumatobacteraceae bacterium]
MPIDNEFAGKVALVTGATSFIGSAISTQLVSAGASVVLGDLDAVLGREVSEPLGRGGRLDVVVDALDPGLLERLRPVLR